METRVRFACLVFMFSSILHTAGAVQAQTWKVIPAGEGVFAVISENDTLIARNLATEKELQKAIEDLRLRKLELEKTKKDLAGVETLLNEYKSRVATKDSIIARMDALNTGYKDLYSEAKRLLGEASVRFEGGVGKIDDQPALMGGFSFRRLSLWSVVAKDNSGGFVGVNVPLHIPFIDW